MDAEFWRERWRRGDIGFHQSGGHDLLRKYWPALAVRPEASVFVPLAGKSVDMRWLAAQGHRVIGVEFSEVAIDQFFAENSLVPAIAQRGAFKRKSAGPYTLLYGDFFELTVDDLDGATAAYDRAALIALPPAMRPRYATYLASLLPAAARVLLISVAYPDGEIEGPPFSVPGDEVARLFDETFDIETLETRDGLAQSANLKGRGVTRLEETAYLLRRRA